MVVVRGVNIYPSAVEAVVRECGGVAEYQVEVDQTAALPELTIRAETGEGGAEALETALRQAFGLRIPVQRVEAGTLPVFEVKAKRWVVNSE
jgi:phenylacetate-CoA ligase